MWAAASVFLLVFLAVWAALAEPPPPAFNKRTGLFEPPLADLVKAVRSGDRAEVGRRAARLGPARLAEALRGADRDHVVAALEAAPHLPGSVRLLAAVTPLLASHDPAVAERAARAAGRMLDGEDPGRLAQWDVPGDAVARACRGLALAAARPQVAMDARLQAVEALADADARCPPEITGALLADPAPEIRRAVLLILRPRHKLPQDPERVGLSDPDPLVAAAAAVASCRRRLSGASPPPSARPLRELALADDTPVEDALEIIPCLAASGDAADLEALKQASHRRPGVVGEAATSLLENRRNRRLPPASKQ